MLRVLLFGRTGQVGYELVPALRTFAEVTALGRSDVDIEDASRVVETIRALEPDVIVNATAYNEVDRAESEVDRAEHGNGKVVGAMGEAAREVRAALIHYSSDFVFDGKLGRAYVESDAPNPLGAYGRSKLSGERLLIESAAPALIFRTAWVYGLRRKSFVRIILERARTHEELKVVSDQLGNPTFCRDLAWATALVVHSLRPDPYGRASELAGVYHLAGSGTANRYELACAALELDPRRAEQRVKRVLPVSSSEFATPAARPTFAPLDCSKAASRLGVRLPEWRDALTRALADTAPLSA